VIQQVKTSERINEILNHPEVYPWVKGKIVGPFDMTNFLSKEGNIGLLGEFGCFIVIRHQIGIYEFHTSVLPEGQGAWATEFFWAGMNWMFTQTDACELLTKCPRNNPSSKMAARRVGFREMFPTRPIWPTDDGMVEVDVYSMSIQEWVTKAPSLAEKGEWFHNELDAQYKALGKNLPLHEEDKMHDRYVGVAVMMIENGFYNKGISFYNRWASMSNYQAISILGQDPLIIDIRESKLRITDNRFFVED